MWTPYYFELVSPHAMSLFGESCRVEPCQIAVCQWYTLFFVIKTLILPCQILFGPRFGIYHCSVMLLSNSQGVGTWWFPQADWNHIFELTCNSYCMACFVADEIPSILLVELLSIVIWILPLKNTDLEKFGPSLHRSWCYCQL